MLPLLLKGRVNIVVLEILAGVDGQVDEAEEQAKREEWAYYRHHRRQFVLHILRPDALGPDGEPPRIEVPQKDCYQEVF